MAAWVQKIQQQTVFSLVFLLCVFENLLCNLYTDKTVLGMRNYLENITFITT